MELLPKEASEFNKKEYWNNFFKSRGKDSLEWYGEYPQLCSILHKYLKKTDSILSVGCGDSRLPIDLYDVGGYHDNVNIDNNELVISNMNRDYTKSRPGLIFQNMDMLQMSFENDRFNAVIDKAALDALLSGSPEENEKNAEKFFGEICRVMKTSGRYICISLLQDHIISQLLSWFHGSGWMIRIHRCFDAERDVTSGGISFPVFVVVCTKLKMLPGMKSILELALSEDGRNQRVEDKRVALNSVIALQHYAFVRHKLSSCTPIEDNFSMELHTPNSDIPRYKLYFVDHHSKSSKIKFAVFIVPQGREIEWLFSSKLGQKQLAEMANCQRLVIVHLNREHTYDNLDSIKTELTSKVVELSPADLPSNYQIPFLSVDDSIGERQIRHRGHSECSGDYIIEEVLGADDRYSRRLIFLSSENIIQSEATLKSVKSKKNKVVDVGNLASEYHKLMIGGVSFADVKSTNETKGKTIKILLIGLGGGCLATYLLNKVPCIALDIVEIDPHMLEVAKNWFGFKENEQSKVHITDGIEFLRDSSKNGIFYDVVMIDVGNKDSNQGLSCPSEHFIDIEILKCIANIITENGVFVLNLVCRNEELKSKILRDVKTLFPTIFSKNVENDVTEIIYCLADRVKNKKLVLESVERSIKNLNVIVRKKNAPDLVDVTDFMKTMKIL